MNDKGLRMNVKDLRIVLEELHGILAATNAKPQSKDIAAFLGLLEGADDQPVEQFLQELEARLAERSVAVTPASVLANEQVVMRHVSALKAADADKAAFDAALQSIRRDQDIDKVEAEAIAFHYIGYDDGRTTWPNKKAALQAIEDWFKRLAFDAVRANSLAKARYAD